MDDLYDRYMNHGGTEFVRKEKRNVIDYYKYWETEAIKTNLDVNRFNYGVLCTNIQGDFNIGSVIRNANAFLAKEVLIYGKKNYDRRGAVGTQNYTNFKHVKSIDEIPNNVRIISVDNTENAVNIENFTYPDEYFLLAFGEENSGIPKEILDRSSDIVYISQYGSVRSLNVGCASAITMYDYTKKFGDNYGLGRKA